MWVLRKIYQFFIDTLQTFLLAASIFLIIYIFFFRPFQVTGDSMYPTFHDKEHILTDLISLRFGLPERGDVIVFKAPPDPEKDFIKRIIGIPGDSVSLKNGDVYVNGTLLDESVYLKPDVKTYGGNFLGDGEVVNVPQKSYFVMGDNRSNSSDSRAWGFINVTDIIGRSLVVYWPPDKVKTIKNPF